MAELHLHYDTKKLPSGMKWVENRDLPMDFRVDERGMRLSPDKTSLRYNDYFTLTNIPPKVFEYRLGSRSALDWVIDQYRVSTDTRSGLRHDPNDAQNPRAILNLIGQVLAVSLETCAIVESLPPLSAAE